LDERWKNSADWNCVQTEKKIDAIRKLDEELASAQMKKQMKAANKKVEEIIEVRKPMDYKTHAHYMQTTGNGHPQSSSDGKLNESDDEEEDAENSQDSITSTKQLIPVI